MEAEGKQRRGSVGAMNAERFGKKVQTQKTSRGNPNLSKNNKERDNNALEDDDDNDNEGLASPSPVTTASLANSLKPPSIRNVGGGIFSESSEAPFTSKCRRSKLISPHEPQMLHARLRVNHRL